MSEALSSFLVSVGMIVAVVLLIPCTESLVRFLRRGPKIQGGELQGEAAKVYSRKVS